MRWATITATAPLRVRLDGDTDPLPFTPDSLVDPLELAVNDRVRCEISGRVIIVGKAGGTPFPTLHEVEVVSASIAVNATWEGTVAIGRQAFTTVMVETSSPARVRIHASAAHRAADLARSADVPPSGINHGVLLDVVTEASDTGPHEVNPTIVGGSLEDPPSGTFPITIKRLSGSTGALTVTLTVI